MSRAMTCSLPAISYVAVSGIEGKRRAEMRAAAAASGARREVEFDDPGQA